MAVKIIKSGDFSLDGITPRPFKKDDVHASFTPDEEKKLIDHEFAVEATDAEAKKAVETVAGTIDPVYADALKVSQAPQAVDTSAVAARVVNDGVTHDSEGSPLPGSTNEEGAYVTHAQDLVNSDAVKAGDEAAEKAEAEEKAADKDAKAAAKDAKADKAKHGKK